MLLRLALLCTSLCATLWSAETVLATSVGEGEPVTYTAGAPLIAKEAIRRFELAEFTKGTMWLAPSAKASLSVENSALVCDLEAGGVQFDLDGLGPYSAVLVRGGSTITRVTGTLFVVVRDERKVDKIALVRGSIQAKLRSEIVAELGRNPSVDVTPGFEVSGSSTGFGPVSASTTSALFAKPDDDDEAEGDVDAVADSAVDAVIDAIFNDMIRLEQERTRETGTDVMDTTGPGSPFGSPPPAPVP